VVTFGYGFGIRPAVLEGGGGLGRGAEGGQGACAFRRRNSWYEDVNAS
jgi:hypothetical protein